MWSTIVVEEKLTSLGALSIAYLYMHADMWITASRTNGVIMSSTDFDVEQLWYAEL